MQNNTSRPLKVFLCYSSEDRPVVQGHYQNLIAEGIDAWFNEESILPGQEWELEIPKAAKSADAFIIFLSNQSITKEGYVQKEIRLALNIADEKPEGSIFIIPARLDNCTVPTRLSRWQWVDLFKETGYTRLLRSLQERAKEKGIYTENNEITSEVISNSVYPKSDSPEWDVDLIEEQIKAASHFGSHARLLAGPGTGKTLVLTRRIMYLIQEKGVNPKRILALTFTRASAAELQKRISEALGEENTPRVSTLHSFALRQLLRNSKKITSLPQPLRIADDWEEHNIIFHDIGKLIKLGRNKVEDLFSQLSADWESLVPEENLSPSPQFISAWKSHRKAFGYTLRSELVYQLKRALEQIGDFELEHPILHLLIDEYQDLNKCDLAVISSIENKLSVELFVAGDDDQSIYYFRKAHPEGIRNFPQEYEDVKNLTLSVCKRCDPAILGLAEFVASLDPKYESKGTRTESGRPYGSVSLLNFDDQKHEAKGVAEICKHLIEKDEVKPEDILILLRTDRNAIFSKELQVAFNEIDVPVAINEKTKSVFDTDYGRQVISIFRLSQNLGDHLAWRSLLQTRKLLKIGEKSLLDLCSLSINNNLAFYDLILSIINGGTETKLRDKIKSEYNSILEIINSVQAIIESSNGLSISLDEAIELSVARILPTDNETKKEIVEYLQKASKESELDTMGKLIDAIESSNLRDEQTEQDIVKEKVNILSMHRAKGLTASVVFILAAEDEIIPGKNEEEPELGDERRLLFVSLTRAKHRLIITYCTNRTGAQQRSGRNITNTRRNLTQFLTDGPIHPKRGGVFINELKTK